MGHPLCLLSHSWPLCTSITINFVFISRQYCYSCIVVFTIKELEQIVQLIDSQNDCRLRVLENDASNAFWGSSRETEHHSMTERLWLGHIIYKWINTLFALHRLSLTPAHLILYSFSRSLSVQNILKRTSIDTCCFRNYVSILTNREALIWLCTKGAAGIPGPSHYCHSNLYDGSITSLFILK